jgi:hypothetical protein
MPRPRDGVIGLSVGVFLFVSAFCLAQEDFTSEFDRGRCTFTTTGGNPYFPLWPGHKLRLEGEEEDDGETVDAAVEVTVLPDTEFVDGVLTRVVEEREWEDDELSEVSRNFVAMCRETGDVWYFGEDVDDYEDGEIVGHEGGWRSGIDGAQPGILMLGSPVLGARYFQENAPGIALDRAEVIGIGAEPVTVPAGTFERTLTTEDSNPMSPGEADEKIFAYGVGNIVDEELELVEITPAPCGPDQNTHCLSNGRFRATLEWESSDGQAHAGRAILPTDDGGAFSFFGPNNPEVLVKVLDACEVPAFDSVWVFAGGMTNVGVTLTVQDTRSGETKVYRSAAGSAFASVLDTSAFTCP